MKNFINRVGLLALAAVSLLSVSLRPCVAQTPYINDHSQAGRSAAPELFVDVQGTVGSYFAAGGYTWTSFGQVTDIDVYTDASGQHIDVTAEVAYYPLVSDPIKRLVLGQPVLATEVLHILRDPQGRISEGMQTLASGSITNAVGGSTILMPVLNGTVALYWF